MSNQPLLDIATATAPRHQVTWSQEAWTWDRFVKRVQFTHRTSETLAVFMTSPKPRQDEIKDVGAFFTGYLADGKRQKDKVKSRSMLVLDIDDGYPDLWEDFICFYNSAALVYSTHKHSPVNVRMRLCMPLDRNVTTEEYEAIARKIAGVIGTKHVCPSSFQIHQFMYWPSSSKDGDYYFRHQQGDWLSADQVLSEYRDWTNVAEWPLCPTESEVIRTDLKKQQDPLEKEGVVGAFCRTYSIAEAIEEFLPTVFTACGDDRYTYEGGSTAAGAVCYEDKWLYSHHSTDPGSGQLLNAFDLIRIHKFGSQDTEARKVSTGLMLHLASTDAKVIHELQLFKLDPTITTGDTDWTKMIEVDKDGDNCQTIDNFLVILRNDPNLKGKFSYNEFDQLLYITEKGKRLEFDEDEDTATLRHYFENKHEMYHEKKMKDAFCMAARDHSFHPIKEYLDALKWDGKPRLDTLFIDNLGVPDTEYTRAVTRKSFTGAVARIMDPGCKFDYMCVTIGQQGFGKSSLLNDMGGDWFSDTLDSVNGKEAYMQIQGVWMLEVAELSSVKKAEVDAVKKFITARKDKYRVPFAKSTKTVKRQTVFFGSTNEMAFLKDTTGNRRFWPLIITKKYLPGTLNPDQYWAEALFRYNEGEPLFLTEELEKTAALQQAEHTENDERAGLIEGFVEMLLPVEWEGWTHYYRKSYFGAGDFKTGVIQRERVCAAEIWVEVFGKDPGEMNPYNTKFIHTALMSLTGWERAGVLSYKKYGNQRSYKRVESVVTEDILVKEKEALL